jgi:Domain of unknown function (DUF6457)
MDGWLEEARGKLAESVGEPAERYDLSRAEMDELLELARVAAHESGERTNAPLICYLVGLAHGRHGGELDDLVDATIGTSA